MKEKKEKPEAKPEGKVLHWHLGDDEWRGRKIKRLYGLFYNRPGIYDGAFGGTSPVKSAKADWEKNEYKIETENSVYHCAFENCFFERQDKSPFKPPRYKKVRKKFFKPVDTSQLGDNDMLLLVGNHCEYYFDSLIYKNKDGSEGKYSARPHAGTFKDTFLIFGERKTEEDFASGSNYIDIRWYVGNWGFEFYSLATGGRKLWIENRGDISLRISGCGPAFELQSGERILIKEQDTNPRL